MSSLPFRTTLEDAIGICQYLSKKPTGATVDEAKKVVDGKLLDFRKITAYKIWGLVEDIESKLRITERGTTRRKG